MFQEAVNSNLRASHPSEFKKEGSYGKLVNSAAAMRPAEHAKGGRTSVKVVPEVNENAQLDRIQKMLSARQLSMKELSEIAMETADMVESATPVDAKCLVNPNGTFRNKWDGIVIVALMFVAIVTPFEVAFLDVAGIWLTVLNRIIDVVFGIDIVLNFLTPFQRSHGNWEQRHGAIAYSYLKSWFFVDVISVLPFEMLRMIRLLRLAKLLRIFRASRVLKRWETRLSISYGYITLTKYIVYMFLLSHWLACLIRLVPIFEQGQTNWMEGYFEGSLGLDIDQVAPFEQYNAALYWSVMTVTTIGYGDVAAKTDAERWVVICAMMVGGAAYAYIVGSVCGLVASMGESKARLHRKIDDLNCFMDEQSLPVDLRVKLREYFHYIAKKTRSEEYQALLDEMSPGMRGDVYRRVNESWVTKLPFVHCTTPYERRAFVTAIAEHLRPEIFPPKERIANPGQIAREMFIIERGVVMMNKSYFIPPELTDNDPDRIVIDLKHTLGAAEKIILTKGNCFGEDMVLTNSRRRYSCVSFTYVELHKLSKADLLAVFDDDAFPETWINYRKYVIKLAFRTKFVHVAKIFEAKQNAMMNLLKDTNPNLDPKVVRASFRADALGQLVNTDFEKSATFSNGRQVSPEVSRNVFLRNSSPKSLDEQLGVRGKSSADVRELLSDIYKEVQGLKQSLKDK